MTDEPIDRRAADTTMQPVRFLLLATLAGVGLGVVARLWMRWMSTDPEFSWPGTIGIVASFSVFAAAQAGAAAVRRTEHQPRTLTLTRAVSALLSIGLFGAAGAVMLPTVLFGSIAVWRTDAPRLLRALSALLAIPSIVFVVSDIASDFGWNLLTGMKSMLFLAIYALVVAATWPTTSPQPQRWTPTRTTIAAVVLGVVGLFGFALYMGGIE